MSIETLVSQFTIDPKRSNLDFLVTTTGISFEVTYNLNEDSKRIIKRYDKHYLYNDYESGKVFTASKIGKGYSASRTNPVMHICNKNDSFKNIITNGNLVYNRFEYFTSSIMYDNIKVSDYSKSSIQKLYGVDIFVIIMEIENFLEIRYYKNHKIPTTLLLRYSINNIPDNVKYDSYTITGDNLLCIHFNVNHKCSEISELLVYEYNTIDLREYTPRSNIGSYTGRKSIKRFETDPNIPEYINDSRLKYRNDINRLRLVFSSRNKFICIRSNYTIEHENKSIYFRNLESGIIEYMSPLEYQPNKHNFIVDHSYGKIGDYQLKFTIFITRVKFL
jgi:hypothetical protein